MKINKYQCLCSNEILKLMKSLFNNDYNLSSLSDNYNNLFDESSTVNYVWSLVSTSLLMSENLYKYGRAYQLISDNVVGLIEDKLYLYPIVYPSDNAISPCLLDSKNHIADSFLHYIPVHYDEEYYDYQKLDEFGEIDEKDYYESEIQLSKIRKEVEERFDALRIDGPYGCNYSIIEDGRLNTKKLIERTRNALAHSNYEVIDENNIRLYHYNRNTKGLDFNVILDSSVIVLMVDELNEIASEKYSEFMGVYFDGPHEKLFNEELTDNRIIEYMLSFNMFDESVAKLILEEAKDSEDFILAPDDEIKIRVINKLIYDKIKPSYDTGIIINDYLYCNQDGKIISDELYDKYDIFEYLNSDYYDTSYGDITDNVYKQNRFKFLLLSLLGCSLLNGYNINENKDIGTIDFSKMKIDDDIIRQFLIKNSLKTTKLIEQLEKDILKNKNDISLKESLIEKKYSIITEHDIENDYFMVVLPSQIELLRNEIRDLNASNISKTLEVENAKNLGGMYNFSKNISHFIFTHLRNSLAHGYVKFPNNIDLKNPCDTVISFEDYNSIDKKELTFKGEIKLGDLLKTITSEEYVQNVFGFVDSKDDKGYQRVKK